MAESTCGGIGQGCIGGLIPRPNVTSEDGVTTKLSTRRFSTVPWPGEIRGFDRAQHQIS